MVKYVLASSTLLLLVSSFSTGCAASTDDDSDEAISTDESDLKVKLGTTDDGKTIAAKPGDQIVVRLPGLGTAGYEWSVVSNGRLQAPRKRTIAPASGSGVGASAAEEFTWSTAGARGTTTLKLQQKRRWESSPIKTYSVNITFTTAPQPTKMACTAAGGRCVGLAPGNCAGTIGDARTYDCGTGVGVMCCLP